MCVECECVRECVSVHACVHVCLCVGIALAYVHVCMRVYVWAYIRMFACMCVSARAYNKSL